MLGKQNSNIKIVLRLLSANVPPIWELLNTQILFAHVAKTLALHFFNLFIYIPSHFFPSKYSWPFRYFYGFYVFVLKKRLKNLANPFFRNFRKILFQCIFLQKIKPFTMKTVLTLPGFSAGRLIHNWTSFSINSLHNCLDNNHLRRKIC